MAVARDQAARIVRHEPKLAEGDTAGEASPAEQLRTGTEETKRRPAETPATPSAPAPDQPAAPLAAAPSPAAPKSGKRRFVMVSIIGLLALAAISYAAYYLLVGRF